MTQLRSNPLYLDEMIIYLSRQVHISCSFLQEKFSIAQSKSYQLSFFLVRSAQTFTCNFAN